MTGFKMSAEKLALPQTAF